MILVGNQRGGGQDLARHLMNAHDNERVELHELRGFMADDLQGALQEAYAISRATKARKYLYSLSLNPPKEADVSAASFEQAIAAAETRLNLSGQPRAIVFHEKYGRRHAHAVWSRIDGETLTARQISHDRMKLQELARSLYKEHGWDMPRGLQDRRNTDPRNFTLEEYQQAKRTGQDVRVLKEAIQEAWRHADSAGALDQALAEHGLRLARGDRRGHVAVDPAGEVYALARWAGVKTKDVRTRLGDASTLRSVDEAKALHAQEMLTTTARLRREADAKSRAEEQAARQVRTEMLTRQRTDRYSLAARQREETVQRDAQHTAQYRKGLAGLWDRLRGETARIKARQALETERVQRNMATARQALMSGQRTERAHLNTAITEQRAATREVTAQLQADAARYRAALPADRPGPQHARRPDDVERPRGAGGPSPPARASPDEKDAFKARRRSAASERRSDRGVTRGPNRPPERGR